MVPPVPLVDACVYTRPATHCRLRSVRQLAAVCQLADRRRRLSRGGRHQRHDCDGDRRSNQAEAPHLTIRKVALAGVDAFLAGSVAVPVIR